MSTSTDHQTRLQRAYESLDGLSIGDAFGEQYFGLSPWPRIEARVLPDGPWRHTDDTAMACSIVEVLSRVGRIDQDALAERFAERFSREPHRGYGGGAYRLLTEIAQGAPWREASSALFHGGSFGNGGAMRAAPIGAYFADDAGRAALEARASAEVTHAHPEGQAGAVCVAVASAYALCVRDKVGPAEKEGLFAFVLEHAPSGETRKGVERAATIPLSAPVHRAASELGTGSNVTAMDTVPFTMWCAARHLDDFEEAMWTTVAGLGDRDTTCAIVGGIVALSTRRPIPDVWRSSREPLDTNTRRMRRNRAARQ